jgi:hypothetical protein
MHLNNQETENFSYDVFISHSSRHAEYWQQQAYSVMLVIRTSEGSIRWMDVSVYLKEQSKGGKTPIKQIIFKGEPFTALNLQRLRDTLIPFRDKEKKIRQWKS